jgi:hypothetical protein
MYATEKYVKHEVRSVNSKISDLGSDLSGEIKDMYNLIIQLQEQMAILQMQLEYESESNGS